MKMTDQESSTEYYYSKRIIMRYKNGVLVYSSGNIESAELIEWIWNSGCCKMIVFATVLCIALFAYFNLLWILKCVYIGSWCYFMGNYIYPQNPSAATLILTFIFVVVSIIPKWLSPKLKIATTVVSIPPQLQIYWLLDRVRRNFKNDKTKDNALINSVEMLMALTVFSIAYSVTTIVNGIIG